jgi:hypothetical protein
MRLYLKYFLFSCLGYIFLLISGTIINNSNLQISIYYLCIFYVLYYYVFDYLPSYKYIFITTQSKNLMIKYIVYQISNIILTSYFSLMLMRISLLSSYALILSASLFFPIRFIIQKYLVFK